MEVASKKMSKRQNINVKIPKENAKKISGKEALKRLRDNRKEPTEIRSKEERVIISLICNLLVVVCGGLCSS